MASKQDLSDASDDPTKLKNPPSYVEDRLRKSLEVVEFLEVERDDKSIGNNSVAATTTVVQAPEEAPEKDLPADKNKKDTFGHNSLLDDDVEEEDDFDDDPFMDVDVREEDISEDVTHEVGNGNATKPFNARVKTDAVAKVVPSAFARKASKTTTAFKKAAVKTVAKKKATAN